MKTLKVLALVSLIALVSFVPAFAQTIDLTNTQASVVITGNVPQILKAVLNLTDLDLDLQLGGTELLGDVTLISNRIGGYSLSVASTNGGKLMGDDVGNVDNFPYTFIFGGTPFDLSTGNYVFSDTVKTTKAGNTKTVEVSFTGYDDRPDMVNADTYSDTLTFTIAAN
ncbi:MAG: hypothetical protein AB7T74_13220 [Clostridia bacterium]|jgi:hypothetical protein|nr:hypothetical protein [Spirochaetia bacterium]